MRRVALVLIIWMLLWPTLVFAKASMVVQPAVGPVGGATLQQFGKNAHEALVDRLAIVGDMERQPAAYQQISHVFQGQLMVTSFPCWYGISQPPVPFSRERGNRLYFSVRILGNGKKIRLANLNCELTSEDAMEVMNVQKSYASKSYNKFRVGIDYGLDGKRDTDDDVIYNKNQPSLAMVDEIIYTGFGVGVMLSDAKIAVTQREKKIEQLLNGLMGTKKSYSLNMKYTLLDDDNITEIASASSTVKVYPQPAHVQIGPVPESPWPLFVGAGAGLGLILLVTGTRQMIRRHRHRILSMTPLPDEEPV